MNSCFRALVVCLFASLALTTTRAADDLAALRGTWKPTKAELAGQPMPPPILQSITLKLDGANYEVIVQTPEGPSPDNGTIAIDAAEKPKAMTVTGVTGPNAGRTFPAIYELTGDRLRICYDLSGAKRPTEFKTAPGTKLYLVDYARAK
jgi:uncharacterized protein (TIGR03067 family)